MNKAKDCIREIKNIKSLIKRLEGHFTLSEAEQIEKEEKPPIVFDLSSINIDTLKTAYRDYSKCFSRVSFDNPTSKIGGKYVFETVEHLSPKEIIDTIVKNYNLDQFQVRIFTAEKASHDIIIYILIANLGENKNLIKADMAKMGYFAGIDRDFEEYGMKWSQLQFEPYEEDDVTDEIIKNNAFLYHWTPIYNLESIMTNGLNPKSENELFSYPPRIYFILSNSTKNHIINLGKMLCTINTNDKNNGEYALLIIDLKNLENNVRFYYDPNREDSVFTTSSIPKERIDIDDSNPYKFK